MLPVEVWEPSCKSSLLPVERKYQKGNQGMDLCDFSGERLGESPLYSSF